MNGRKEEERKEERVERRERNEWKGEKEKMIGTKELRPSNYTQEKESE